MSRGHAADLVWFDEQPLFQVELYRPRRTGQTCDRCGAPQHASDDELRVSGWVAFDGHSATRKELHVRICPRCK